MSYLQEYTNNYTRNRNVVKEEFNKKLVNTDFCGQSPSIAP